MTFSKAQFAGMRKALREIDARGPTLDDSSGVPRRAYRPRFFPDEPWVFDPIMRSPRDYALPSYGICLAHDGGPHARPEDGICPRCGQEVTHEP